ncbi:MAG: hypothetical protein QM831_14735 [Kofleriaceae bacterium]
MRSLLFVIALSAVSASAPPAKWTIRQRIEAGDKVRYVAIAEIDRTGAITPLPAPELDKITDEAAAAWKTYKPAASITITENLTESASMAGEFKKDVPVTFTAKEPLYPIASLRAFADAHKLTLSGMGVSFVDYDTHNNTPKGGYDGSTSFDHFRKSKDVPKFGKEGYILGFLEKELRTNNADQKDEPRWISKSNPKLKLARDSSNGNLTVAWVKLYKDGHVEYTPKYARDELTTAWREYKPEDVEVSIYENDMTYLNQKIPAKSPINFEAQMVQRLAHYDGYDLEPVVDVAMFR